MNLKQLIKFGIEESSVPVIKNPILRAALEPRSTVPGPRNMYSQGQLVTPSVDGSRPGYGENRKYEKIDTGYWSDVKGAPQKYDRKKIFKDINLEKYTKYIEDHFKSGDMSKAKVYKTWLNDKYGMKKGSYIYSETYKEFGDDFVRKTQGIYRNKKNELLRDLVNKANLSEKWGVEKKDILKKIISSGQTFKKYTPDEKVFALSQKTPWLDREYLDTLHKRKDKVKMVFNNIVKDDEIIGPSKKYKRIHPKGNIISDMIMEKTGLTDIKTVRAGISETNWYKQNEDLYRYMTHRGGRGEIKGLSFSEAIKFADEKRGSLEIKNLMGKRVKYQTPENHIVQFSARHVQRHFRDGTWKDSQIKFYKNGKLMTEADWAKLPTTDRGNKILDWNKVSFKYGNKVFHKGNLRTEGSKSGLFDEVYKLNRLFSTGVTDPNNIKGPKIPLKELLNIMEDKLVLGHDDAKGGVKAKPFSNLKIQSQSVNDALFKAYSHIKDKSLRKQVVKEIWGESLSGKSGQKYIDLFIEGAEKDAKNYLKNIDKVKISPYRLGAQKVIGKLGSDFLEKSGKFQSEALKVGGIDWRKPEGRLALKTLTTAKTLNKFLLSKGHKICRGQLVKAAGGGRIGFKGMCGAEFADNFPKEFINRISDYPGAANAVNGASKGAMSKFLNAVAKDVGNPLGWIGGDVVFSTLFSGAAEAAGKTPLEALDEGLLWFLPKGVIDAKKKALFGYEGTPSGAYKMEGHAGMYDKDQIADMSAFLDLEEADRKWNQNTQELKVLNETKKFGQVTSQQIEKSKNRLQSNINEATIASDTLLKDVYTRNTGLRFEDGKPFKKELSEEEFGNLYGQIGENLWDVQKRHAMAEINRGKQADLNTFYANRKGTIPGFADLFAKGTHALGWTKEGQLPLGMGERGTISTAITDPWDRYRASSPMKAGERLPAGIKQGYQKVLDLWNMGLISQEKKEQYAKDMGRYDLLYKEHEHPLYGPGLSYEQHQKVFPEYFGLASGGRAGYMGGGIASILKPSEIPPERGGLRSIMINDKKY